MGKLSEMDEDSIIVAILKWLWAPISGFFLWIITRFHGRVDSNEKRIIEIEKDAAVRDESLSTMHEDITAIKDVTTAWREHQVATQTKLDMLIDRQHEDKK